MFDCSENINQVCAEHEERNTKVCIKNTKQQWNLTDLEKNITFRTSRETSFILKICCAPRMSANSLVHF